MGTIHVISRCGQPGNKMTLIACRGRCGHSLAKNTVDNLKKCNKFNVKSTWFNHETN